MNAIICDRCRSIITAGNEDNEVSTLDLTNSKKLLYVKTFHLCTRCAEDFDKFMKNEIVEVI